MSHTIFRALAFTRNKIIFTNYIHIGYDRNIITIFDPILKEPTRIPGRLRLNQKPTIQ